MQKVIALALVAISWINLSFTSPQNPDTITGTWYCEALDQSTFQVSKEASGVFNAIIIKSADPTLIGKTVMKNVTYNPEKRSWEGTIISVKRKKELDGVFSVQPTGQLKVVGSLLFFYKTFYWDRVK